MEVDNVCAFSAGVHLPFYLPHDNFTFQPLLIICQTPANQSQLVQWLALWLCNPQIAGLNAVVGGLR